MPPLADLHRAVQAALAGKRLGKPVFVRYLLHGPEKPEAVVRRLAQLAGVVRGWISQAPERVYAVGSPADGQVSLTLQFREGATALVSFARGRAAGPGADVTVFGNHGALYHDAGDDNVWDEAEDLADRPDPQLEAAVERSLRSGKQEPLPTGAPP
jgi:predicted dehydrogenase